MISIDQSVLVELRSAAHTIVLTTHDLARVMPMGRVMQAMVVAVFLYVDVLPALGGADARQRRLRVGGDGVRRGGGAGAGARGDPAGAAAALLIGGVNATQTVLSGGLSAAGDALRVSGAFDVVIVVAGVLLFEHVVRD